MFHQSRKLLHDTGFFLYPWKTSESPWFSDVLREYRKRPVEWNGLRSGESYSVDKMHGNPVNRWSGAEIFSNFPVIRMLIYRWSFAALLFCGKSQVFSIFCKISNKYLQIKIYCVTYTDFGYLKATIFGNSRKWSRRFSKRCSSPNGLFHSPLRSKGFRQSEVELSLATPLFLTSSELNYLRQRKDSFLTSAQ